MRRPPRSPAQPLLPLPWIGWGVLQGALAFAIAGAMFVFALRNGMPNDEVRALTFVALILGMISLILVNPSFSSSAVLNGVVLVSYFNQLTRSRRLERCAPADKHW